MSRVGGPFARIECPGCSWCSGPDSQDAKEAIEADWSPSEPEEILATFTTMLRGATTDGAKKRQAGTKVSWKVDPGHEAALFSHLNKWKHGETHDPDSGAHPLVHLAWRALAIAYQEIAAENA